MKRKRSKIFTQSQTGEDCPRCGWVSQERKHKDIESLKKQNRVFYSKWFYCVNPKCKTTIFFNDVYKIKGSSIQDEDQMKRFKQVKEQLSGNKNWRGF